MGFVVWSAIAIAFILFYFIGKKAIFGQKDSNILMIAEHEGEWMVEGRSLKVRVNDHGGGRLEGRSLKVRMNDYEDPSANRGHDPRTPAKKVGNGNHGGRRG